MRQSLVFGVAAAALLSLAAQANAATVVINSSSLTSTAYTVHIGGTVDGNPVPFPDVYESPELMNVSFNGGPPQDVLAFCVDLFHLWSESDPPVTYVTSAVANNSDSPTSGDGTPLGDEISGEIGYLTSLAASADLADLAAIQGAIWEVEYPSITLSGGSTDLSAYTALATTWAVGHPSFSGHAVGIYPLDTATGGFGFTQGFTISVPEPATWTLAIGGFALSGATLRRRRQAPAV